jgi:predicted glycosyltransferase
MHNYQEIHHRTKRRDCLRKVAENNRKKKIERKKKKKREAALNYEVNVTRCSMQSSCKKT